MNKRDALQALASVRLPSGKGLVASGHIQDILIEQHGEAFYLAVLIDTVWEGAPPPKAVLDEVQSRLMALPHVAAVKVVPRSKEHRPQARPLQQRQKRQALQSLPSQAVVVAVTSGKGGVGKSTVSVNLAVALRQMGLRTAILDCDIYGFSVPQLIGLQEKPRLLKDRLLPPRAEDVQVMSIDFFLQQNEAIVWRGPMLGKALQQLAEDTLWDPKLEIIVLDLPPGTGDIALDVSAFFPQAKTLLVSTPDPFAARVAVRAGLMAQKSGHTILGVVENMAYQRCPHCNEVIYPLGQGGADAVAQTLQTKVLVRIPSVVPTAPQQNGLFVDQPAAWQPYEQLAKQVIALSKPEEDIA